MSRPCLWTDDLRSIFPIDDRLNFDQKCRKFLLGQHYGMRDDIL